MTKLRLKTWSKVGDVLTSEELKHVCGGIGSGSDEPISCSCVYNICNDPLIPYPYETSKPLIAYTSADCITQCDRLCYTVGISDCEAICGSEACKKKSK